MHVAFVSSNNFLIRFQAREVGQRFSYLPNVANFTEMLTYFERELFSDRLLASPNIAAPYSPTRIFDLFY